MQIIKYRNGVNLGPAYTEAEMEAMREEEAQYEAYEKHRPLRADEVAEMFIRAKINTISVDDGTALRMSEYYPAWESGADYAVGERVRYGGKLYRVLTAHTSQADWAPDTAVTLFVRIDEEHDGTKYDPIPYDGNMALEAGRYYVQEGIVYRCIRDTVNPVYHALAELVGVYVEEGVIID